MIRPNLLCERCEIGCGYSDLLTGAAFVRLGSGAVRSYLGAVTFEHPRVDNL